jgi:hypothetical protein
MENETKRNGRDFLKDLFLPGLLVISLLANFVNTLWSSANDNHVTANQVILLTKQAEGLANTLEALSRQIGEMPTTREVADQKAHSLHVDVSLSDIGEKISRDETTIATLDIRIRALETPLMFRNVKHD